MFAATGGIFFSHVRVPMQRFGEPCSVDHIRGLGGRRQRKECISRHRPIPCSSPRSAFRGNQCRGPCRRPLSGAGEYVYVHVGETAALASMPKIQSRVRLFLGAGEAGQWEAVGRDWFQENPSTDLAQAGAGFGAPAADALGIMSQAVAVGTDTGLKVTQVKPGSPAAAAGIEVGDILVEVDRMALRSQDQLSDRFARSNGKISLTVRDVRTGRDVLVEVAGAPAPAAGTMQPFGAITELAFYNGEATVKVTSVSAGSPAQKAGLVPGLLILKANGQAIASPKDLEQAEAASRGKPGTGARRSQGQTRASCAR